MASIRTRTAGTINELSMGTARWAAPESTALKPIVNEKSDVYGLGIVLWELAARSIPFFDIRNNVQVILLVKEENARPPIPPDCPKLFSDIFTRCWDTDPEKRPSAEEVHKYFVKYFDEFKCLTLDNENFTSNNAPSYVSFCIAHITSLSIADFFFFFLYSHNH
jgi:serine/threonine protein kinase